MQKKDISFVVFDDSIKTRQNIRELFLKELAQFKIFEKKYLHFY